MRRTGSAVSIAAFLFLLVRILGSAASHPVASAAVELLSVIIPTLVLLALGELRRSDQELLYPPRRDALLLFALLPLFIALTALLSIPSTLLADLLGLNRTAALSGALPALLFGAALLPALVEELFCRFVCLAPLGARKTAAVWLSAILFALLHVNFAQIPYAFCAGLLLGALASVSGSVWIPIAFHFANNAVSLLLWYFGVDVLLAMLLMGALGLLPLFSIRIRKTARVLICRIVPTREAWREIRAGLLSPLALPILACLLLSLL